MKNRGKQDTTLLNLLEELQNKLERSPVFTGDFESLLAKMKNVDENLISIRDAIYDPTDGIFKRITDVEKHMNANMTSLKEDYSERLHETRADITNLVTWKETATETIKSLKENESLIVKENTQLKHEVNKLITWKEKAEKVFMLMFLPTLGFMIKLIWAGVIDLLSKAVK